MEPNPEFVSGDKVITVADDDDADDVVVDPSSGLDLRGVVEGVVGEDKDCLGLSRFHSS